MMVNLHYYCEVSGSIEHYFKKHNGYPIPNMYVPTILKKVDVKLLDDGFHYELQIGDSEEKNIKCMFGFANEKIYNKLMNGYLDYVGFRRKVNNDTKLYEGVLYDYPSNVFKAMCVIEFIKECYDEGNLNEIFEEMKNKLEKALSLLTKYTKRDKGIEYSIQTCKWILENMLVIKLFPIVL